MDGIDSTTVVIGDLERWKAEGRFLEALRGFHFVNIDELTKELLEDHQAEIILSPLVAHNFDAVDVVAKLIEFGFRGRYRAISEPLPDSEIIRKEVRQFAPQIDFDLMLMPIPETEKQ